MKNARYARGQLRRAYENHSRWTSRRKVDFREGLQDSFHVFSPWLDICLVGLFLVALATSTVIGLL